MGLDELHDALRGFHAFAGFGHEGHAHALRAGRPNAIPSIGRVSAKG